MATVTSSLVSFSRDLLRRFGVVILVAAGAAVLNATIAVAETAFVVGFSAYGESGGCAGVIWRGDTIFYNTAATVRTVKLLHASKGSIAPGLPRELVIAPQTAVALGTLWSPTPSAPYQFWVNQLDIPPGVILENRNEALEESLCGPLGSRSSGKLSLPVFRQLAPPDSEQVILGADSGDTTGRINVSVYNGAPEAEAVATIEVRRSCDGALMDTRTVAIPADSIVQVTGLAKGADLCRPPSMRSSIRHIVVRVSQPSFAFASVLTDRSYRGEYHPTPFIEFAVPVNYAF